MKRTGHCLPLLSAALLFGGAYIACSNAYATVAPLPGGPQLISCSKARDPRRCEAHLKARHACGDKRGTAKHECMDVYLVAPDCSHADQPKQCAARRQAEHACHGKQGKAFNTCVKTALAKKPAKSKSTKSAKSEKAAKPAANATPPTPS